MAKYLILYLSSTPASELMSEAGPDEMEASRQAWMDWKVKAEQSVKFEFGMPLQTVGQVTHEGLTSSDSKISGYSMMEGEKSEIEKALLDHPNLKRAGSSIEILEMLPMPGI